MGDTCSLWRKMFEKINYNSDIRSRYLPIHYSILKSLRWWWIIFRILRWCRIRTLIRISTIFTIFSISAMHFVRFSKLLWTQSNWLVGLYWFKQTEEQKAIRRTFVGKLMCVCLLSLYTHLWVISIRIKPNESQAWKQRQAWDYNYCAHFYFLRSSLFKR